MTLSFTFAEFPPRTVIVLAGDRATVSVIAKGMLPPEISTIPFANGKAVLPRAGTVYGAPFRFKVVSNPSG